MKIVQENEYTVNSDISCDAKIILMRDEKVAFDLKWENGAKGKINIMFSLPCIDFECVWEPTCTMNRRFEIMNFSTSLMGAVPLIAYVNNAGNSVYALAASESVRKLDFEFKINEYTANIDCIISLAAEDYENINEYLLTLYIQKDEKPLYEACKNVSDWWESILKLPESQIFERIAVSGYNTWYSYHHNLTEENLLSESAEAKKLGMDMLIVDSGWFNDSPHSAEGYSGDWEPSSRKIKDMKAFTDKIHSYGMQVLLWYGFSFIGFNSKVWERFKDKILCTYNNIQTGILDPRYPEIREYMKGCYIRAAKEWNVDGFKFDFIDAFRNYKSAEKKKGMDFATVEAACEYMMREVTESVRKINKDIIIECRQGYTGPYIRNYANYLGPVDSPMYYRQNRVGITDLRLTSGNTLVYSDMLMWNENTTTEQAALQVLNVIFGLLHFSVKMNEISEDKKQMIRFWTDFSKKHRETLFKGKFMPLEMQNFYPVISSESEEEAITAVYEIDKIVSINAEKKNYVINACDSDCLCLKTDYIGELNYETFDCMGNKNENGVLNAGGILRINISKSGMAVLTGRK